ncbi:lysophospholipid acyltransferase family protein [Desulfobacterales bacterium HSG16]|nr:lysophospholipid acyltransferase family protein [Desulfobacterales bacterium HSG16]
MCIIVALFSGNGNSAHKVARMWAKSILLVSRVKISPKGLFWLDRSRPYIYMSNHQSHYDIPVLYSCLDVQFRWLAKVELFKIPIFGQAMKQAGYISINRSNRQSAFESLDTAAAKIRNGVSVLIFPEGTRSNDDNIGPYKKGGFVLAVDSGVPIVPVVIRGTRAVLPKREFKITPGNVTLEIKKPIDTFGYSRKNKDELLEIVRKSMSETYYDNKGRK